MCEMIPLQLLTLLGLFAQVYVVVHETALPLLPMSVAVCEPTPVEAPQRF